jgi:uncharacterized protein (DUF427 family)
MGFNSAFKVLSVDRIYYLNVANVAVTLYGVTVVTVLSELKRCSVHIEFCAITEGENKAAAFNEPLLTYIPHSQIHARALGASNSTAYSPYTLQRLYDSYLYCLRLDFSE